MCVAWCLETELREKCLQAIDAIRNRLTASAIKTEEKEEEEVADVEAHKKLRIRS